MKLRIAVALLLQIGSLLLFAQTSKNSSWKPLFNGKDLSGWKQLNGKAHYSVENGEIVGTTVANEPNSFLATTENYGDFILEFEFRQDSAMNSGVQFRSESKSDYLNGRVFGYQFEIDPSPRAWTGGIYDEGRRDWLYPLEYNPSAKKAYKHGQWNKCRIECAGNIMRTFINGVPAAYLIDDATSKGFIALQVHSIDSNQKEGAKIRWRNIKIQTDKVTPSTSNGIFVVNMLPNNLSDIEKNNGIKLLWDGKTTEGWRGAYKNGFPKTGWLIENGELSVLPSNGAESTNGGDIITTQKYSAFVLQFDFKLTEGANSGVKYFITESEKNTGSAIGLEYQVLDDAKHPDAKLGAAGNRTLASLYDLIPSNSEPRARKKIGEWNKGMIVVYPNNKIEHWLNGYKVVEFTRGTPLFNTLVARSKYEKWPQFGMAPEGYILLQDHGDKVSYRSIKIKELKDGDMPNTCNCL